MTRTPFWTTQNGVVGTAHISRNGAVVNFLAAREPRIAYKWSNALMTECIVLDPHRGVAIEPLVIPATVTREQTPTHLNPALWTGFLVRYSATFKEVTVSTTFTVNEQLETAEAKTLRETSARAIEAENLRQAKAEVRFRALTAREWVELGRITTREWGKLASPVQNRVVTAILAIRSRIAIKLGYIPKYWDTASEELRIELLTIREEQRREKKAKFEGCI